jgi:hypothetical protein
MRANRTKRTASELLTASAVEGGRLARSAHLIAGYLSRWMEAVDTEATALAARGTDPVDSSNLTMTPAMVTLAGSMRLARVHRSAAGPSRRGF